MLIYLLSFLIDKVKGIFSTFSVVHDFLEHDKMFSQRIKVIKYIQPVGDNAIPSQINDEAYDVIM